LKQIISHFLLKNLAKMLQSNTSELVDAEADVVEEETESETDTEEVLEEEKPEEGSKS
jgi:hypothetical protein